MILENLWPKIFQKKIVFVFKKIQFLPYSLHNVYPQELMQINNPI